MFFLLMKNISLVMAIVIGIWWVTVIVLFSCLSCLIFIMCLISSEPWTKISVKRILILFGACCGAVVVTYFWSTTISSFLISILLRSHSVPVHSCVKSISSTLNRISTSKILFEFHKIGINEVLSFLLLRRTRCKPINGSI